MEMFQRTKSRLSTGHFRCFMYSFFRYANFAQSHKESNETDESEDRIRLGGCLFATAGVGLAGSYDQDRAR
jgi:hypothetical protein